MAYGRETTTTKKKKKNNNKKQLIQKDNFKDDIIDLHTFPYKPRTYLALWRISFSCSVYIIHQMQYLELARVHF